MSVEPSPGSCPLYHKAEEEEKVNPYESEGTAFVTRKQMISLARQAFSERMLEEQEDDNLLSLSEKCVKILRENLDRANKLEKVNDIAHLIFDHYLDEEIEDVLPIIHQKYSTLNGLDNIDETLRDEFRARAHMLHGIGMKLPIIKAIEEVFKDRNFGEIKLDLRKQL